MSFSDTSLPTKVAPSLTVTAISDAGPLVPDPSSTERPTHPAALDEALFGGPAATYAVIDAARIEGLPEMLAGSGEPHACLMHPDGEVEYGDVSPWIVRVAPGSGILRNLFTEGDAFPDWWSREAAIFLRSTAPMEAVRAHLRRLIHVPCEGQAPLYFRFWDPGVAWSYFDGIAEWPDRIASLMQSRHATITEVLVPHAGEGAARRFVLEGSAATPVRLTLDARDRALLGDAHLLRFRDELADWLPRADPLRFRAFRPAHRAALAEHAIREGRRFGLSYKEEYAYFLYMMTFLGGWFHVSPMLSGFANHLREGGDDRFGRVRRAFPEEYRAAFGALGSPTAQMGALRQRMSLHLEARGGWSRVRTEDALDVAGQAERILGLDPDTRDALRREAMAEAETLGLGSHRDRAIFYALWVFMGTRFNRDPLFPWVGEKLAAFADPSEGLIAMADYAHRRLGRSITLQKVMGHE